MGTAMSAELEAELSKVTQFLYACPIGLVDFAMDGTIDMMNPKAMQLLQPLSAAPFVTNFFTTLESCGPEVRNLAQGFGLPRGTVCENHRIIVGTSSADAEGEATVLACTVIKLSRERFTATLADISRQVAQERRLRQAETWFSSLLESAEDFAVLSLDAAGRIDGVRLSVLRHTGLDRDAIIGHTLDVLDASDPDDARLSAAEQVLLARRDGWYLDEGWQRQGDGGRRWCQRLIVVRAEDEAHDQRTILGYTVVLRSVTRQEFDTAKLRRMLQTDHLTGVCNRARLFQVAERDLRHCVQQGQQLAVIALDVDHFKRVNDTHGHGVGDEVLKSIARACGGALLPGATFARLGGEEFVVVLPSVDLQGAVEIAERLRAVVAALSVALPNGTLSVTASLGCATLTASTRSFTALLAQADKALYAAKRSGRNRVGTSDGISAVA